MPLISAKKLVASVSSGHVTVSTGPIDVCKTPAPPAPAPIPLPYPNIGATVTMGGGYATKTLSLGTPIVTKKSTIMISNGDQPGVAMGIISNKIMGSCSISMASSDVDAEGGGVTRSMDKSRNNG